ncbi:hypothetical protein [Micromonospora sp. CPCC 205558]|uniref:hypothetical protein n=1 Tax=Micromonospora sp. CPCC 205558 TaxID=3122403 RepID=UPI002FEEC5F3
MLAPVKSGRGSQNIMHTPHDLFLETPRPNLTSTARATGRVNSPPPPEEVGGRTTAAPRALVGVATGISLGKITKI